MEEINDEYIKKYFKGNKRIINTNLVKYYYNKEGKKFNYEIYKYIMNRYNDSTSFKESLYRIFYNIEKRPKCKYCNKTLEYKNSPPATAKIPKNKNTKISPKPIYPYGFLPIV